MKPLYLSRTGQRLRFASALPALLKGGDINPILDPVALNHYLNFHAVVPAPRTLLAGIEKLPPATWMRIEADGRTEQKTWWTLPYGPHDDEKNLTLEDWRDRVLDSTRDAVAIRQRAAVDVGVLLSGGVDSSMLVGLLREVGVENLSTFSIGFQDAGGERGDEFQYSDLIAKHYGTRHHQLRIDEKEIIEQLPAAFRAMSEPMVSHDCIAFYLLSREVAKHCKVVQSGQGADELFAGYHWYPQVDGASDPYAAYREAFFDRSYDDYAATVQPKWLTANDAAGDFVKEHFAQPGADAAVDKALRLDSTVMLVDDPVKRVDNMTMAWGLEARTPFLDYRLVELSARVPGKFKLPDGGKQVLEGSGAPGDPQRSDRPQERLLPGARPQAFARRHAELGARTAARSEPGSRPVQPRHARPPADRPARSIDPVARLQAVATGGAEPVAQRTRNLIDETSRHGYQPTLVARSGALLRTLAGAPGRRRQPLWGPSRLPCIAAGAAC